MEAINPKKLLRKAVTAKLRAMTETERTEASERIQTQVLETEEYRSAKSVLLYLHLPTEPDTDRIIRQAIDDGKAVYVPK